LRAIVPPLPILARPAGHVVGSRWWRSGRAAEKWNDPAERGAEGVGRTPGEPKERGSSMRPFKRVDGRARPRRGRLVVEAMEARDLPSILPFMATAGPGQPSASALALRAGDVAAALQAGSGATPGKPTQGTPAPPILPGAGQPTPAELARERFRAYFNGPFYAGPGRFTDQSKILYFRGVGGSTQFLHGDFQMALVFPSDPSATITGAAYMQDKNINSGGALGLDLTIDPTSLDRRGRPTRATFASDPNIYSGVDYFDSSTGTVRIGYHGGAATVIFDGLLYTSQITNPIRNQDLQSRGGRLFHRGI
jgi:hypothetical protein